MKSFQMRTDIRSIDVQGKGKSAGLLRQDHNGTLWARQVMDLWSMKREDNFNSQSNISQGCRFEDFLRMLTSTMSWCASSQCIVLQV